MIAAWIALVGMVASAQEPSPAPVEAEPAVEETPADAAPSDDAARRAAAARLVRDREQLDGVDGVEVRVRLRGGVPWVRVRNTGDTPLVVRWQDSRLAPPNGEMGPMVALPGADPSLPSTAEQVLAPGDDIQRVPFPLAWVEDGPDDDAAQLASWTQLSFSALELVVARGEARGVHRSEWRTEIDPALYAAAGSEPATAAPDADAQPGDEPVDAPLAVPAAVGPAPATTPRVPTPPAPAPRPPPDPATLEARAEWDRAYRAHRRTARVARPVWVTGAVVGGLSAIGTYQALRGRARAPQQFDDLAGFSRQEYGQQALLLGALTAAGAAVTIPFAALERSSHRKVRELGRRP